VDVADSPLRFPEWWTGIESTTVGGDGDYTMYVGGYPDFPMPQTLDASRDGGTKISVHVDIPESEAARLDMQRDIITSALRKLGTLAAASGV
jgi:hypothetical protein